VRARLYICRATESKPAWLEGFELSALSIPPDTDDLRSISAVYRYNQPAENPAFQRVLEYREVPKSTLNRHRSAAA
jgi:hypothetical protein